MLSSNLLTLLLACIAGGVLGAIFFGGLWWTVRKGVASRRPVRWFLGSLLLRMTIVVAGIYYVSAGQWDRMLACLIGLVGARLVVTRLTGADDQASGRGEKGISCV
jgi:F1F0 ATPase subunit 2